MRFFLNGQFSVNGRRYWRVEDMERMEREERDGTYNPIAALQGFDLAINCSIADANQARAMVDALNRIGLVIEPRP